jgi:hypothetical protein
MMLGWICYNLVWLWNIFTLAKIMRQPKGDKLFVVAGASVDSLQQG